MVPAEHAVADTVRVEVVYCPATGQIDSVSLQLPQGSTLAEALAASGLRGRHALPDEGLRTGIWGKPKPPETVLVERDRIEIYRPLRVDPKEARRQRYQQHRERVAARAAPRR